MTNREPFDTIRSVFPDLESIVSVGLGLGSVLFFLDAAGVDVIANLQGSSVSEFGGVGYMVGLMLVSKAVERFREAVGSERDAPTAGR